LYKTIDKQLHSHHQEVLNHYDQFPFSSSISPPTVSVFSPPRQNVVGPRNDINKNGLFNGGAHTMASSLSVSPFGPLDQATSRKVFTYVISVLNASDPDHDFSSLQPEDFKREQSPTSVINTFNNVLFGLGMPVPPQLWECLDNLIDIKDCTVYTHSPLDSFLADEPGTMWSMMWFFFNKRRKRIAYLHLKAVRHYQSPVLVAVDTGRRRKSISKMEIEDEEEDEYDLTYSSDSQMYEQVVGDLELE
jgi:hypothetical protein